MSVPLFPQSSCLTSALMNRGHGGRDGDYAGLSTMDLHSSKPIWLQSLLNAQPATSEPLIWHLSRKGTRLHVGAGWLIEALLSWKKQCFVLSERETSSDMDLPFLSTVLLPKPASLDLSGALLPILVIHTSLLLTKKDFIANAVQQWAHTHVIYQCYQGPMDQLALQNGNVAFWRLSLDARGLAALWRDKIRARNQQVIPSSFFLARIARSGEQDGNRSSSSYFLLMIH